MYVRIMFPESFAGLKTESLIIMSFNILRNFEFIVIPLLNLFIEKLYLAVYVLVSCGLFCLFLSKQHLF